MKSVQNLIYVARLILPRPNGREQENTGQHRFRHEHPVDQRSDELVITVTEFLARCIRNDESGS